MKDENGTIEARGKELVIQNRSGEKRIKFETAEKAKRMEHQVHDLKIRQGHKE